MISRAAHLAQVVEAHAMLAGAHQLGDGRTGVALLRQFIEVGDADVVAGQRATARRPSGARGRASASSAANAGFEANSNVPAATPSRAMPSKVNVPASRRMLNFTGPPAPESCAVERPSSAIDGNRAPGRRVTFGQPDVDGTGHRAGADLPCAPSPGLRGGRRGRRGSTHRCRGARRGDVRRRRCGHGRRLGQRSG